MLSLRPMLADNLLPVGGRVAPSFLPFDSKHQIILAKKHHELLNRTFMLETAIQEKNSLLIFQEKGSGLSMLNHLLEKYC